MKKIKNLFFSKLASISSVIMHPIAALKKIKNLFFSKLALIFLVVLYLIAAFVSGAVEYLNGSSFKVVLFLRGGTMVLDAFIIGLGGYAFTRKWLNKKFEQKAFFRKRLFWLAYIAETLAIFLLFYLPYVVRSLYLLLDGKTIGMALSGSAFRTNLVLGFLVVIILGAWMKKIMGKLTKQNDLEERKQAT